MTPPGKRMQARKKYLRETITRYGIKFEGLVTPSDYPEPFKELFQQIYHVDQVRYSEYGVTNERDAKAVTEMKMRVQNLKKAGVDCYKSTANEATWRHHTEALVLARFSSESKCKALEGGGRPRPMFAQVQDEAVAKFAQESSKQLPRFSQKPDCVIGLNQVHLLSHLIASRPELVHSPFDPTEIKPIYPFLVIEAKSAKADPGSHSVDVQTALPIRHFLRIQAQLQSLARVTFHPLVWFLAFAGDAWHVYGCTYVNEKCHIYDLWQGSIRSVDKALRLLLIIDIICDWARYYRSEVQRCLAQDIDIHQLSSSSRTQSFDNFESAVDHPAKRLHMESIDETELTGESPNPNHSVPLVLAPPYLSDEESSLTSSEEEDYGPQYDYHSVISRGIGERKVLVTVRHIDQMMYRFRHIELPEEADSIQSYLEVLLPKLPVPEAAQKLIELFESNEVFLNSEGIDELERLWIGKDDPFEQTDHSPYRVLVLFATFFQRPNWQPVRQVTCITCSPKVATVLNRLASQGASVKHHGFDIQRFWQPHLSSCSCLLDAVRRFKCACRREAALAAWQERRYVLRISPDQSVCPGQVHHFRWGSDETLGQVYNIEDPNFFDTFHDPTTGEQVDLPGYVNSVLNDYPYADHVKSNQWFSNTPFLFVRPISWPTTAPELCFLQLEPCKTDLQESSIRLLEKHLEQDNLSHVLLPANIDEYKREYYRRVCHHWLNTLKNDRMEWSGSGQIIRSCIPDGLIDPSTKDDHEEAKTCGPG